MALLESTLKKSIKWQHCMVHIMPRDLLTQKSVDQKTVTDFRYPRACRFRKHQIKNRLWELPLPLFSKRALNS
jgi:hypothetical protein